MDLRVKDMMHVGDDTAQFHNIVEDLLKQAKQKGANQAEISINKEVGINVQVRKGDVENIEYHRGKSISVHVFFGQRTGAASTTDLTPSALQQTLQAACDIARFTNEDPCAGLADAELMAYHYPDLDLYHPWDISVEQACDLAKQCEAAALSYDKRITNSDGANFSSHQNIHFYANTHGFVGSFPFSVHSLSCSVIGEQGDTMQREHDFTLALNANKLWTPQQVGISAAKQTVERLGARRLSTRKSPVIFTANMARGLIQHFLSAIAGSNLYRKSSFLLDHLNKPIFPKGVSLIEDPFLLGSLGSAPFDGEGVKPLARTLVADGILQGYMLSSYSARKLGMQTTGNADGAHNILLSTAMTDFASLVRQMGTGLIVTDLMGQGVSIVNGNYSRGAAGFWVENGEIQYPVEEITVASNLQTMFMNIVGASNDVDMRSKIQTGSLLIEQMTIAGE